MGKSKTHCKRGHEFTPENTYLVFEDGYTKKRCKQCGVLRQRKHQGYTGEGSPKKKLTHCKRGHEFTMENTYIQVQNGVITRKCEKCRLQRVLEFTNNNRDYVNKRQRDYMRSLGFKTKEKYRKRDKERKTEIKLKVISHYSPSLKCVCCGESEWNFLSIDHIHNNGNLHKKQNKNLHGGASMYYWLIKHNFPKGFQVLCMNCNFGKRMNDGICPHTENPHEIPIIQEWTSE